jgi:hypothetical protein
MILILPLYKRSRKYGYIYWKKAEDPKVKKFFGNCTKVKIWFQDSNLGEKKIGWKYRRISIGWSKTRSLEDHITHLNLSRHKDGSVRIVCK